MSSKTIVHERSALTSMSESELTPLKLLFNFENKNKYEKNIS